MKKLFALTLLLALGTVVGCSADGGSGGNDGNSGDGSANNSGGGGGDDTANGGNGNGGASNGGAGNDGSSGGDGDGATGGGATGGGEDGECVNTGEINFDCPFTLPPIAGSCAPHGSCCQRASNNAKIDLLGPDEPAVLEYRLNYVDVINHPLTVGNPSLAAGTQARSDICSGEQCLLWRFTVPRSGGQFVQGMGEAEIGVGAYNCDGTYSFYGEEAAPARDEVGESDPGRWASVTVPMVVDPAKEGTEQYHIPFATNRNRETVRSLFVWPADRSIDWELASAGFEITEFDTSEAGRECMGARDGFNWSPVGGFVSYSPIEGNDSDISNLTNQTYCSLLAFGLLPEGMKNLKCADVERCMPGTADCKWVKLPDSLCPKDADELATFGCHLGAEGNPNDEDGYPASLSCTQEKPTEPLDPDSGATSDGQCCDPLGKSSTLPACNAYRTVQLFVAAAAEITDAPRNDLPPLCD